MRQIALTLLLMLLTALGAGCHGPLPFPMVQRLDAEEQIQVDDSWENMFSPVDRLDRSLLLDAIMAYQLHTRGVDRLRMTSEKFIEGAVVELEVIFDRDQPESDVFLVTLIGDDGYELRREEYAGEEVLQRLQRLSGVTFQVESEDGEETEEQLEIEARMEAIRTATQPAFDP